MTTQLRRRVPTLSTPRERRDVHWAAKGKVPSPKQLPVVTSAGPVGADTGADDERGAPPARVLVVEDEESFVDALTVNLEREGFSVTAARDGVEALERFALDQPDLVLLDVMLPRLSGIDVCRAIRANSTVPIIMVTAKSTELDTVVGLEVGADDYVVKPYRVHELVSRMRAVLRRAPSTNRAGNRAPASSRPQASGGVSAQAAGDGTEQVSALGGATANRAEQQVTRPGSPARPDEILQIGDVVLDLGRHECIVRGEEIKLPLKEFELLEMLLSNPGRVVTRDTLIDRVWGMDYVGDTKTLDVHIKRLRSRVERDPSKPVLITTIRGLGYRFESPRR
ncbi:MAG: response regulator transcription factor [Acidimicrobiales bacterium]